MGSISVISGAGSMARRVRGPAICIVAVLAATAAVLPSAGPARAGASPVPRSAAAHRRTASVVTNQDWPAYLFSAQHPSATTGPATITLGNAGNLKAAWKFRELPATGHHQPQGGFSASPTVAGGMVFIGTQTGDFYALRELTGQLLWKHTIDYEQVGNNGNCNNARGIVGTATAAADPQTGNPTVYVPGARYLYAFDAATGCGTGSPSSVPQEARASWALTTTMHLRRSSAGASTRACPQAATSHSCAAVSSPSASTPAASSIASGPIQPVRSAPACGAARRRPTPGYR